MSSSSFRTSAAACAALLASSLRVTNAGTNQQADVIQQRMFGTGCLPGPFRFDAYPTCVTAASEEDAPWAPWTSRPYCADNTSYCAFTNSDFQGPNRGVSIIDVEPSSIKNASLAVTSIAKLLSSPVSAPPPASADESSPPYEMRDIPGKGNGLIATRKIPRGQVFMVDYAALVVDSQLPGRVRKAQGVELLKEAIERLSGAEEVLSLARSSQEPESVSVYEDVMKTNAFTVEITGKAYMALFPRIARMNHACKPNVITRFNGTTLSNIAMAFRDISPGEELSISYSTFGLPSGERQEKLLSTWGFKCTCDLCSLPPDELAASDDRRIRVTRLSREVIDLVEKGGAENMKKALELYKEAVDAVEEEGLVPHMGNHYQVLGQLWAAVGDVEKGREWVKRGKEETAAFEKQMNV
ncbi:hypothetical protein VTI28DRAFT_2290 [Corynascus sepedonium]